MWLDLATMASEGGSAPLLVVAAAQPGEASECSHSKCSTPLLIVGRSLSLHDIKRDALYRGTLQYVTRVLAHYPGEQPDVKPEWPMTRPLESFLDFYVSPTTHLVRPSHALTHTHIRACTAAPPPLPNSPEPTCARTHLCARSR